MKNAFVTGGSGLVGYHLTKRLVENGVTVRCLVRASSRRTYLDELGVDYVEGDLHDLSALRRGADGVDAVFHVAGLTRAIHSQEFFDVNRAGCRNVADAILANAAAGGGTPTLLSVSSLAAAGAGIKRDRRQREIYGSKHRPRRETDLPVPFSPYGKSKLAGEMELIASSDRIPTTVIRPSIVLGEMDSLSFPLFKMAKMTPFFWIPGYSNRPFSFVYAEDLADIIIRAAKRGERLTPTSLTPTGPAPGETKRNEAEPQHDSVLPAQCSGTGIYFAAGPDNILFSEFGRMLGQAVGRKRIIPLRCPPAVVMAIGLFQESYKRMMGRFVSLDLDKAGESLGGPWICSAKKAEDQLGFRPVASFQEELNRTARWYAERHWL